MNGEEFRTDLEEIENAYIDTIDAQCGAIWDSFRTFMMDGEDDPTADSVPAWSGLCSCARASFGYNLVSSISSIPIPPARHIVLLMAATVRSNCGMDES